MKSKSCTAAQSSSAIIFALEIFPSLPVAILSLDMEWFWSSPEYAVRWGVDDPRFSGDRSRLAIPASLGEAFCSLRVLDSFLVIIEWFGGWVPGRGAVPGSVGALRGDGWPNLPTSVASRRWNLGGYGARSILKDEALGFASVYGPEPYKSAK
jgi:hypothetical protein